MDENLREPLKQMIHKWVNDRHQALLEQVMMTWEEGMGRLNPDDAFLGQIQELLAPPPAPPAPEDPFPDIVSDTEKDLGAALNLIEASSSQGEVLKRLLEGLQPFVERSALFVIKQGIASLFATRGFESDLPKPGAPVVPPPPLEELIQGRVPVIDAPGPAYLSLLTILSRFEASDVRILPLRLRRKTVALLLVDSGLRQVIDHPNHVRALTHTAEATLSFLAGLKEDEKSAATTESHPSMPTQRVVEPIPEPPVAPLDPKIRANAERSARVLVGDIELYFPNKVVQGRQKSNLYAALRDELDRSLASFVERYTTEVENQHHIFYQTVVHQLCEGDATKLGPAPWAPRN
jgi:hypothetical protein